MEILVASSGIPRAAQGRRSRTQLRVPDPIPVFFRRARALPVCRPPDPPTHPTRISRNDALLPDAHPCRFYRPSRRLLRDQGLRQGRARCAAGRRCARRRSRCEPAREPAPRARGALRDQSRRQVGLRASEVRPREPREGRRLGHPRPRLGAQGARERRPGLLPQCRCVRGGGARAKSRRPTRARPARARAAQQSQVRGRAVARRSDHHAVPR